ncbi:MAG: hypothetical protein IJ716_13400, partial [Lachnospiraceae bacterium]|nr:hypothetical protein [Lachnospiraceae bacterium]
RRLSAYHLLFPYRQKSAVYAFLTHPLFFFLQSELKGDTPDMHLNFYVNIILLFLWFVNT